MTRPPTLHAGRWRGAALAALLTLAGIVASDRPAAAEDVVHEHAGLGVVGRLEIAAGKTLARDGVALILHGTLAHHGMEIVKTLQDNLKAAGYNTLAITLGLGLDKRRGMFDCRIEHDHRHTDAVDEIASWIGWLKEKGATRIALVGHSRGAAQVAAYAKGVDADPAVDRIALLAPLLDLPDAAAAAYKRAFGADLADTIALARKHVDAGEDDMLIEAPGFLYCPKARVTAAAFLDYYRPSEPRAALDLLGLIGRPVLLVAAGGDEIAPGLAAAAKARGLQDNVRLVTIEDADHFFRDLFADDLAAAVNGFLAGP